MRVLIYGTTGNIGSRITREALQRGHEVTAVVRDASRVKIEDDRLETVVGDVLDSVSVAMLADGRDAVLSAVGAGIRGPNPQFEIYRAAAESLVTALRRVNEGPRLLVVGSAGSLEVAPGVRLLDTPQFPAMFKDEALAQAEALKYYRSVTDVAWTYISPAAVIEPGERTGSYRTGEDELLTDDSGDSRISTEDYAVAVLDELEHAQAIGRRLGVAY